MEKQVLISKESFKKSDYQKYRVVADIGANNSYLAILGIRDFKRYNIILKHSYQTSEIKHLYEALNTILKEAKEGYDIETGIACIGGAGPISRQRNYIKLTNADFEIKVQDILSNTLLNKVILINDFEAIGYGVDILDLDKDVIKIPHVGEDLTAGGNMLNSIAVIGASKGLGMTIASFDSKKCLHAPIPSEGGHMDFSPYNKEEYDLAQYIKKNVLEKKNVQPEMERLVSVDGIGLIYDFLTEKKKTGKILLKGLSKIRAIENSYSTDPVCKKTLDMFISFYARAARNLALMSECYAGLFITGKISLIHKDRLLEKKFMEMFEQHDKRSDVLRKVPVYLITNQDVGLYGCCDVTVNFFNL